MVPLGHIERTFYEQVCTPLHITHELFSLSWDETIPGSCKLSIPPRSLLPYLPRLFSPLSSDASVFSLASPSKCILRDAAAPVL